MKYPGDNDIFSEKRYRANSSAFDIGFTMQLYFLPLFESASAVD
ncbi:hypothetical protein LOT_1261 [Lentilactobacillus otakiensis DSM 19908 = JCM 15040]|uniref:Uncharacterized protein n=1 Tax=Lentilactobacillus otakiensis DSM 19908 = JCM 15040 TaxID=1423780 RepID=S4NS12_9LACO|nr:hypothetical protein LOT_1261 [Lentilactobacillus otakiensis DSM 19908 = JCM 15040]